MKKVLSKREEGIQQTANQVFRDIGATRVHPELPEFAKIVKMIGKQVSLNPQIIDSNENIRKNLGNDSESFDSLRSSIQTHGILQSILVELRGDAKGYRLVCVEGHRRLFIAKETNLSKVPCILASYSSIADRIKAALATSLKDDLSPIDRAEAFQSLLKGGISVEEISDHEKKNVRTVKRYLKMASWPKNVRELIRQNPEDFPVRFLFQKLAHKDLEENELLAVVENRLSPKDSSRKVERRINTKVENRLIELVEEKLGLQGIIKNRRGKRYIEIEIENELQKIISKLDSL